MDKDKKSYLQTSFIHTKRFISIRLPLFVCVHLWLIFLVSCSSQPVDLRNLAPAETLVYLETNDLGKTLNALTENKAFEVLAKNKPDYSALENIQTAIAVTGFETSQQQVTSENSVLSFKPRFVAIAETHAWNWQTLKFAENKLGEFVNEIYGGEVSLETSDKSGGKWFVWTATDGRKAFAFVQNSRIFFGNDETAIEKSLAVQRGEADSFAKNGKNFENAKDALAFGYISGEGVAQIANLVGVSAAIEATEEDEGRNFIAGVLPSIVRNSVKEIFWTATKTDNGIQDKYSIPTAPEVSAVLKETLISDSNQTKLAEFLPSDIVGATRYNLQNPQIAWRSLLLVAAKQTDAVTGKILVAFSESLLESYGVTGAETFLSAIDSEIITAQFDGETERSVAVVGVKNIENIKKSITEINFKVPGEKQGNSEVWKSEDGEKAAAFVENKLIIGDAQSVLKSLQAKQSGQNLTKNPLYKSFAESGSVAVTFEKDDNSAAKIVEVIAETKTENQRAATNYLTETRFSEKGIERKTVSPFGLIGTILEQMEK
ncbi:MAG TPA: hypothetical protein VF556_04330 [Pyrinomonadaceae bacterium]|jgi:phosphotransferase system IIB component